MCASVPCHCMVSKILYLQVGFFELRWNIVFFLFGGIRSGNILSVDLGHFDNKAFVKERFMVWIPFSLRLPNRQIPLGTEY